MTFLRCEVDCKKSDRAQLDIWVMNVKAILRMKNEVKLGLELLSCYAQMTETGEN